jgi:hypothetical protein
MSPASATETKRVAPPRLSNARGAGVGEIGEANSSNTAGSKAGGKYRLNRDGTPVRELPIEVAARGYLLVVS